MLTAPAALAKDRRNSSKPVMEHRHYAVIASIIADLDDQHQREQIASHFASRLASTNPNFNKTRFLAACEA